MSSSGQLQCQAESPKPQWYLRNIEGHYALMGPFMSQTNWGHLA